MGLFIIPRFSVYRTHIFGVDEMQSASMSLLSGIYPQLLAMFVMTLSCHVCDDLEKLSQGQIGLQNFQLATFQ